MLALRMRCGGYVFVYCRDVPIGAIRLGQAQSSGSWYSLGFSGDERDFQILRPSVVARRFGEAELSRLVGRFGLEEDRFTGAGRLAGGSRAD